MTDFELLLCAVVPVALVVSLAGMGYVWAWIIGRYGIVTAIVLLLVVIVAAAVGMVTWKVKP